MIELGKGVDEDNLSIHTSIDELLHLGEFKAVDGYIGVFLETSNMDYVLSLLISTFNAKEKLPNRSLFFEKHYDNLVEVTDVDYVNSLN
jgi:hypothetical protein